MNSFFPFIKGIHAYCHKIKPNKVNKEKSWFGFVAKSLHVLAQSFKQICVALATISWLLVKLFCQVTGKVDLDVVLQHLLRVDSVKTHSPVFQRANYNRQPS